jgi:hypothetical protein
MKRPWLHGAAIMSRLDRTAEAAGPREPGAARPGRHRPNWWTPRPSTILAATVGGIELFTTLSIDKVVPVNLTGASGAPPSIESGAMAAKYVIAAALLASACLTTQILACLLVESPRLTIRSSCLWIAAVALFLALWRSGSAIVLLIFMAALAYSVAGPLIVATVILARRPSRKHKPVGRITPVQATGPPGGAA